MMHKNKEDFNDKLINEPSEFTKKKTGDSSQVVATYNANVIRYISRITVDCVVLSRYRNEIEAWVDFASPIDDDGTAICVHILYACLTKSHQTIATWAVIFACMPMQCYKLKWNKPR